MNGSKILDESYDTEPSYNLPDLPVEHYIFKKFNFKRRTRTTYHFSDCYISFDFTKNYMYQFFLFDDKKRLIKDLSYGDSPTFHEIQHYEIEPTVFLEDFFVQFNVCHYLLDKFPRLYEFENEDFRKVILFREDSYISSVLEMLNKNQLNLDYGKKFSIKFKDLFISSSSFTTGSFIHPGQNIYKYTHEFIDETLQRVSDSDAKNKIFIDRSNSSSRRILNQKDLDKLLFEYQFKKIKLEEYSFKDQVKLFKSAEIVVGVHGAGLTNVAFCSPDTPVIEIISPLCATNAFAKLAIARGLNYIPILGVDEEKRVVDYSSWKHNPALYNRRDILAPIEEIRRNLEILSL